MVDFNRCSASNLSEPLHKGKCKLGLLLGRSAGCGQGVGEHRRDGSRTRSNGMAVAADTAPNGGCVVWGAGGGCTAVVIQQEEDEDAR